MLAFLQMLKCGREAAVSDLGYQRIEIYRVEKPVAEAHGLADAWDPILEVFVGLADLAHYQAVAEFGFAFADPRFLDAANLAQRADL